MTLYLSDLDGTLLSPDGLLSAESAALLREAMAAGALVSYATSRSRRAALNALRGFHFNAPCVVGGGYAVTDPEGRPLLELRLGRDTALAVVRAFLESGAMPFLKLSLPDGEERVMHGDLSHPGQILYAGSSPDAGDGRFMRVTDYDFPRDWEPVAVFAVGGSREIGAANAALRDLKAGGAALEGLAFHDPYTGYEWAEALPEGADKGRAALVAKAASGADRLVCFGDGLNDLPLFGAADLSVASPLALPAVASRAALRLAPSGEDEVARFIRDGALAEAAVGSPAGS